MGTYRRKPLEMEAIQFRGDVEEVEKFTGGHAEFCGTILVVITPEGPLWVYPTDYIVKGFKGEFYPVPHDVFKQIYEEA